MKWASGTEKAFNLIEKAERGRNLRPVCSAFSAISFIAPDISNFRCENVFLELYAGFCIDPF
jgi:hypothetical protein